MKVCSFRAAAAPPLSFFTMCFLASHLLHEALYKQIMHALGGVQMQSNVHTHTHAGAGTHTRPRTMTRFVIKRHKIIQMCSFFSSSPPLPQDSWYCTAELSVSLYLKVLIKKAPSLFSPFHSCHERETIAMQQTRG